MRKKKEILQPIQSAIKVLDDYDAFIYSSIVDYDYDRETNCQDNGCNGICRCGVIANSRINSVDVNCLIANLMDKASKDTVSEYCVDRTIRSSGAIRTENWELNIERGYYGQEIRGVELDNSVKNNIVKSLTELSLLSDLDKIKKLLENEYGYLLPKLKEAKSFNIIDVKIDDVIMFNDQYMRKVSKEDIDHYADYTLPRAVCTKEGKVYAVVDGFHRMISAKNKKEKTVSIIELEV